MRIRFKPWARPELEASKFYRDNPEELKNKWIEDFKNKENPIHLELGCGKGSFISELAFTNKNIKSLCWKVSFKCKSKNFPLGFIIVLKF